ncbi:ABC-2 type transport system permease protein [Streptomyces sp. DvalAA-14]|uniref:ABC transporter permease n=1 Tax=unclassified Streptomyces TaxID=2593676 RepID=UPI00081B9E46|nr:MULTISPECIES: ABC transporter permease [unclassified Streptomyces]MYS21705.1 ABC transporter permease [Streptomyces sp. SID4948]SCD99340.1 ABC-2 type transport system permease protein [Streptomyces sp. DvalAA-14]
MPRIWVIAANNLLRLVRQPIILFTTLVLPFAIITIVGLVLGNDPGRLTIGVVAHGSNSYEQGLVHDIQSSSALHTVRYSSDADLETAVRRGQVGAGLVVPANFGPGLDAGTPVRLRFLTTPDQSQATTIRTVVNSILDEQIAPVQAGIFSHRTTGREVRAETARARRLSVGVELPPITGVSVAKPSAMRLGVDYTGPSNLTLFVILTSMTSSAALVESRVTGITRRVLTMPMSRWTLLAGELLARLLISLAQAAVILVFCSAVFKVRWGDPLGVGALTLALCAFGAALGMLVGFAARTTAQAIAFGPPVGVALGMLGGCMWPLNIVGGVMRTIGHFTPNAWAMDGYVSLINTSGGIGDVLRPIGVIAAMTAALLVAAAAIIRRRSLV